MSCFISKRCIDFSKWRYKKVMSFFPGTVVCCWKQLFYFSFHKLLYFLKCNFQSLFEENIPMLLLINRFYYIWPTRSVASAICKMHSKNSKIMQLLYYVIINIPRKKIISWAPSKSSYVKWKLSASSIVSRENIKI